MLRMKNGKKKNQTDYEECENDRYLQLKICKNINETVNTAMGKQIKLKM